MAPTGLHWKRFAEQGQFPTPRSTRRRPVRSIEQLRDEVVPDVIVANREVDLVVEEVEDPTDGVDIRAFPQHL